MSGGLMGNLGVYYRNSFMQKYKKDTQPSQTCSGDYTFPGTALYSRGVSLYLGTIN